MSILEAARLTASAMNAQPWHFIAVQDPARIAEIASHTKTGPYVVTAPLVPFGYPADKVGRGGKRRKPPTEVLHSEEFGRPYRGPANS